MPSLPVMVEVEEDDDMESQNPWAAPPRKSPDHPVIESFNTELENLSSALEGLLSRPSSTPRSNGHAVDATPSRSRARARQQNLSQSQWQKTRSHSRTPPSAGFSGASVPENGGDTNAADRARPRDRDPPTSSSSQYYSSDQRPTPSRRFPSEAPPPPVETPYVPPTPASRVDRNRTPTLSNRRHRSGDRSNDGGNVDPADVAEPMPTPAKSPRVATSSAPEWSNMLETMRQTLARKDECIANLETQNEELRGQVAKLQAKHEASVMLRDEIEGLRQRMSQMESRRRSPPEKYRPEPSPHRSPIRDGASEWRPTSESRRYDPTPSSIRLAPRRHYEEYDYPSTHRRTPPSQTRGSYFREEPNGRHTATPSVASTFRSFSPGTNFVVELSRIMKMEKEHHAPLSILLDKHWDRLRYHFQNDDQERRNREG